MDLPFIEEVVSDYQLTTGITLSDEDAYEFRRAIAHAIICGQMDSKIVEEASYVMSFSGDEEY